MGPCIDILLHVCSEANEFHRQRSSVAHSPSLRHFSCTCFQVFVMMSHSKLRPCTTLCNVSDVVAA